MSVASPTPTEITASKRVLFSPSTREMVVINHTTAHTIEITKVKDHFFKVLFRVRWWIISYYGIELQV